MAMFQDIINRKYGKLLVISYVGNNKNRHSMWKCKCDCGNEIITLGTSLRVGRIKSCGCYQKERASQIFLKDIAGKRFGRLMVLHRVKTDNPKDVIWKCRCDCGEVINVKSGNLNNGKTKSCGCLHRDIVSKKPYWHLFHQLQRIAEKNGRDCSITFDEFLEFTNRTTCHYCGKDIRWDKHRKRESCSYNLDRKDNRLGYSKDNIEVCCPKCNKMKGTFDYKYFYEFTRPIRERWQPI